MDDDARHHEWCAEFDYLTGFVNLLHERTQMWEAIDGELVRMQLPGSGDVVAVFRPIVGAAQGVLVRRLLDDDSRTRSLVRLAGQMAKYHKVLTRRRFVDQWKEEHAEGANAAFDQLAGKLGRDYMPRGPLLQLREAIVAAGADVIDSINQMVTHDQRERTAQPFTWGALETAITGLSAHYVQIGQLLRGSYYEPIPYLAPGWKAAFKQGLFGPDAPPYDTTHFFEKKRNSS